MRNRSGLSLLPFGWASAFAIAVWTAASPSHAQEAPSAQSGSRATATYDELIAEAVREFDAEHYQEARALFERAHEVLPNARTLRGIGMACFELRDYPHAWVALRGALTHPERPLTAAQRGDVRRLLDRTERLLARVELTGVPDGARILVDGTEPVMDGRLVLLGPGEHVVGVRAAGFVPWDRTLEAPAGRTQPYEVAMTPAETTTAERAVTASAAVDVTPTGAVSSSTADGSERPTARRRSPWPWVVAGAGVAVAGTGLVLGSVGLAQARDANTDGEGDHALRLTRAGDTLMATGGAIAIGGLVWGLLARGRRDGPPAATTMVVSPSTAGVDVRFLGRF